MSVIDIIVPLGLLEAFFNPTETKIVPALILLKNFSIVLHKDFPRILYGLHQLSAKTGLS